MLCICGVKEPFCTTSPALGMGAGKNPRGMLRKMASAPGKCITFHKMITVGEPDVRAEANLFLPGVEFWRECCRNLAEKDGNA